MHHGGLQNVYSTAQLHFHWGDNDRHGSEHTINGVPYPLEVSFNSIESLSMILFTLSMCKWYKCLIAPIYINSKFTNLSSYVVRLTVFTLYQLNLHLKIMLIGAYNRKY